MMQNNLLTKCRTPINALRAFIGELQRFSFPTLLSGNAYMC